MSNWDQDRYLKAHLFAAAAHRGQLFSDTDLPYLVHLNLVAMEVIAALPPERMGNLAVECALLHDTLEDTEITYQDLKREFGEEVAEGVAALSKDSSLPRERRIPDSLERIQRQPIEIWMVKLADRISNLLPPPNHWGKTRINSYYLESGLILRDLGGASAPLAQRLQDKQLAYKRYL